MTTRRCITVCAAVSLALVSNLVLGATNTARAQGTAANQTAANQTAANQTAPNQTAATGTAAADAAPSNAVSLSSIAEVIRRVRTATLDIINDVEQRKIAIGTGDPLFIEPPTRNHPQAAQVWAKQQRADLGKLQQPKPSWINADVAHLQHWIDMLNQELAATNSTSASWTQIKAVSTDINNHFAQLKTLTAAPPYKNVEIGIAALQIHDDLKRLEKPWRDAVKSAQKR